MFSAPATITEKLVLAAKHEITESAYVAAEVHAPLASASPEYIIRPVLFVVASLPPINHRL